MTTEKKTGWLIPVPCPSCKEPLEKYDISVSTEMYFDNPHVTGLDIRCSHCGAHIYEGDCR